MRTAPGSLTVAVLWTLFSKWPQLPTKTKIGIVAIPAIVTTFIVCAANNIGGVAILALITLLMGAVRTLPADWGDPLYQ